MDLKHTCEISNMYSRCTNNAIRKNNRCTDMEKFETADKGLGLKATADIPQGMGNVVLIPKLFFFLIHCLFGFAEFS